VLIWLIEDDAGVAEAVARLLAEDGHTTRRLGTAGAVRAALAETGPAPDLVCLDLLLPDGDGRALCGVIKSRYAVPLLVLSALNDPADRVAGLELGADDYLGKPFHPLELRARVRALFRRYADEPVVERGPWRVEPQARRVLRDGVEVRLTAREFDLFWLIFRRPGRVWTRDAIVTQLWGEAPLPESRAVDMLVRRLRQKIEENPDRPTWIETVRHVGYRWRP
jgi:two-component system response regulator MtrA